MQAATCVANRVTYKQIHILTHRLGFFNTLLLLFSNISKKVYAYDPNLTRYINFFYLDLIIEEV